MTDLALREPTGPVELTPKQLSYIANTEFVPAGLRGNMPAILACVATGRELGIGDLTALRSIHIIDGKATFSAELMVQLVRKAGHSIEGEWGDGAITVVGKRADNGDTMKVTWTLAMAERAGLAAKSNWKKHPEAMLWARAVSQLSRALFADCFAGATYVPEELGEIEAAELAEGEPTAESALTVDSVPQAAVDEPASPSAGQLTKLNVLVGTLRTAGQIQTEHLYLALGREAVPGEDGLVHWSDLRETLTRAEAHELIERLSKFEEKAPVA